MTVVEDNSLEFALQETAKGFSRSGKNQNQWLPPQRKRCSGDFTTGFGESAIFQLFVRVKEYMSKDSGCILVIGLLRSLMEGKINGFDNLHCILFPKLRLETWVRGNFNCYSRQSFRVLFPFLWSFL